MESLQKIFNNIFILLGLDPKLAQITLSGRPDLADYQINGALSAAKILKKSPVKIADEIISQVPTNLNITLSNFNGFINIKLTDNYLLKKLETNLQVFQQKQKVVIDFSSPNVAKSMHVGHVRSTLIGQALANMYKYQGSEVISDNHIGDFGTPLGVVITKIKAQSNFNWTLSEIESNYIAGASQYKDKNQVDFIAQVKENTYKLQNNDSETLAIWQKIVDTTKSALMKDYEQLGIHFDWWKGESYFQALISPMLKELAQAGKSSLSEGAVVLDVGMDTPLILQKQDGSVLYHTTDLACIQERLSEFNKILYVVDKRQNLHFQQIFTAAQQLGWVESQIMEHVAFGTINGDDNKPFKTRDGGVLKLSDLIKMAISKAEEKMGSTADTATVGLGALKFAELKHNRLSDYVFDLDKFMALDGFTGPYVMYAAVRAQSILHKVNNKGRLGQEIQSPEQKALILTLNQFGDYFTKALQNNEPHVLCEYSYNLASQFNNFYHKHSISQSSGSDQLHLIYLVEKTVETLTATLSLLGIKVPAKM